MKPATTSSAISGASNRMTDSCQPNRRFALPGLAWKGMAVLLAVCLVNALRRNVNSRFLREDLAEWFIDVRHATFTGLIVGIVVVLAVTTAVNRLRWRSAWLYAATLAAACVASAIGV